MTVTVDTAKSIRHNLGIKQSLALLAIEQGALESRVFLSLVEKGLITYDVMHPDRRLEMFRITPEGAYTIEAILAESKLDNDVSPVDSPYYSLARKLQEVYPSGYKDGTQNQWRDSTFAIADRLKILVNRTGIRFTDEEAVEATRKYVESFNGNYRYMQLLKFYVCRTVTVGADTTMESKLISCIENPDLILSNNWSVQLV